MKAKLVKENLNEALHWDIAGEFFPTPDEKIETSSEYLIITYAAEVIEHLMNISNEYQETIRNMCEEYKYLIENGFEQEDNPEYIAQNIWDLWLSDDSLENY